MVVNPNPGVFRTRVRALLYSPKLVLKGERSAVMQILVLVPDMKQHGGVTNIFRELKLNCLQGIDYFTVNAADSAQDAAKKSTYPLVLLRKMIRLPRIYLRFLSVVGDYELVHSNPSLNPKSFFRDAVFIFLALSKGKKVMAFFHGWEEDFERRIRSSLFLRMLFKLSYARVPVMAVLGDVFRQRLLALGVRQDCTFLPITSLAGPRDSAVPEVGRKFSEGSEIRILFLSRVVLRKGVYLAIDTLRELQRLLPRRSILLVVAGDGEELRSAEDYAEKVCPGRVRFLGFVEDDAKRAVLADCQLMLLPSYSEGLPNCILEGMLFGQPIVSRRVGAIPDVVVDGVNGFLTDTLDPACLAELCARILSDEDVLLSMARTNRAVALERYTNEAVKGRLLGYYRELLGHDPGFLPRTN